MVTSCEHPLRLAQSAIRLELSAANYPRLPLVVLLEEKIGFSVSLEQERIGVIAKAPRLHYCEAIKYCLPAVGRGITPAVCDEPLLPKTNSRPQTPQRASEPGRNELWHNASDRGAVGSSSGKIIRISACYDAPSLMRKVRNAAQQDLSPSTTVEDQVAMQRSQIVGEGTAIEHAVAALVSISAAQNQFAGWAAVI